MQLLFLNAALADCLYNRDEEGLLRGTKLIFKVNLRQSYVFQGMWDLQSEHLQCRRFQCNVAEDVRGARGKTICILLGV
jgi:hypothetical protein